MTITYWYHPESETYFTVDSTQTVPESVDALCVELTEEEYRARAPKPGYPVNE